MKLTPASILEAPVYYADHIQGKYDIDKVVIFRDCGYVSENEIMPQTLKLLPERTNIVDFTNNELDELPPLGHSETVHTLLLSRNRLGRLDASRLPRHLENLNLAMNRFEKFEQLQGLRSAPKTLKNLNLRGNVVCHKEQYRETVLALCPQLAVLDGERVRQAERQAAVRSDKADTATESTQPAATQEVSEKELQLMDHVVNKMDKATLEDIKQQLAKATTLAEIERLEKLLSGGVIQ
ncbi:AaceriAFL109Wp [[Ashbya] aceris (nom. inval.)]|nr:AaceriAFL109Wp [[Ashbya] aceris (nom. inval.)]